MLENQKLCNNGKFWICLFSSRLEEDSLGWKSADLLDVWNCFLYRTVNYRGLSLELGCCFFLWFIWNNNNSISFQIFTTRTNRNRDSFTSEFFNQLRKAQNQRLSNVQAVNLYLGLSYRIITVLQLVAL